jgi:endoglucanase
VNPQPMFHNGEADHISADYLAMLDSAVKTILDNNLAVVIDIHPDGDFKAKLTNDSFVEQFGDYWRALAKHYSSTNPEKVFFEILNEPEMRDRYRWNGIEAYLVNAIREGAPQHTIIVEGARWADDDDLLFLEPVRDANVIYNFHYYEPHLFTHQGAAWGDPWWHHLSELPYPSTPENVQDALTRVPDAAHRLEIARYGAERWNPERIDADFAQIAAWAKKWDVPVVCNEFGVYRKAARPEDRAAWLRDVRTLLEKHGIGWTMWDYAGGFGVVTRDNGQTTVDPVTVKALGLQPATNK